MSTYKIVRMFQGHPNKLIGVGLSLKEAQAWCRDEDTSSSTEKYVSQLTRSKGQWFDGYESE